MFARIKKTGQYQYLQIVQNRREGKKTIQRVISTLGRLEELQQKGDIESLVRSISRFSETALMVLSGKSLVQAQTSSIGPALIFERLWRDLKIGRTIGRLLDGRKFEFDVERAIFLTVLHRLFVSGSDRCCDKWQRDLVVSGSEDLKLHHLYRAMSFLGEEIADQQHCSAFTPRCTKDVIEEDLFAARRDLFTGLDCVFFDTTSIYFEGEGGQTVGEYGHSKDHRPDLKQMVVGVVLDDKGHPVCCEMWPGNTTDVKSLIPVVERLKNRFHIRQFCVVCDRGMISQTTLDWLEENNIFYILGARMRNSKEVKEDVLSRAGRYREVRPEGTLSGDPSPLKVKEVMVDGSRYIVCRNEKQARKDVLDREAIIGALEDKLKSGPKALVGNKGFRKYLKAERDSVSIDRDKIEQEARFDGKWVLKTNTRLSPEDVALKYKELWQVEQVFRDMKSILETRPIYHQTDEAIRGHVFCSFLALLL
ncbi:MAG: IS1634 family transposase, partial [Desulfatirhabdiaceae bacterium]|nr:IS1634 family transposase [Desulfatirhabdiaceae bacterium]